MTEEQEKVQEEVTSSEEATTGEKTYTQTELDAFAEGIREEESVKYKGIQRVVSQKDQEIKSLKNQPQNPQSTVTVGVIKELEANADGDPTALARIQDLKYQLAQEQQTLATRQRQQVVERENQTEREKIDAKIREAGLDPSNEIFVDVDESFINASLVTGNFDIVNRKLDRVLKTNRKAEPKKEVKETDEEKTERLDREYEERHGLRTPETAKPSASGSKVPTRLADFNAWVGKLSSEEYKELAPQISQMQREGRIK